jgi:phage N-6-adenine-methyltransferase
LLICATASNSKQYKEYLKIKDELQLPPWGIFTHACAIALVDLVDCIDMTAEFIAEQSRIEILCGDWQVGRYAWKLENIQPLAKPFAVKGKQGFFSITATNQQLLVQEKLTCNNPSDACIYDSPESEKPKSKTSDLWYTPENIAGLIVKALVKIDLDPCADEGKHIPATLHYTASDDGLSKEWHGRVFMNPPYSCPGKWMKKLQAEFEAGRVTEALALVPAATETNWLSPFLKTNYVYFWKGRIKFLDANYQTRLSARQAHVLVYWGSNPQLFKEVFSEYGEFHQPTQVFDKDVDYGETSSSLEKVIEEILSDITKEIQKRLPGSGNGYIHWRTITKNGKDYPQAYYQWKENGKDRTKYVPKKLLGLVEDANEKKRPVIEILRLLGVESGDVELLGDKRPIESESIETSTFEGSRSNSRSNEISPSKIRRGKGSGSGNIHWRTITKKGKDYQQAYYHYEFWDDGDCLVKSTRYIPKRLLSQVSRMEREKVPVKEILKVLGVVK